MAWREVAPYGWGSAPRAELFTHLLSHEVGLPASLDGTQLTLESCLMAVASVHGLFQPPADRRAVLTRCAGLAETAVAATPTDSFGWYARAYFSFAGGNGDAGSGWLIRSRTTAPSAQWIAENRVALAERYFAQLTDTAQRSHREDLALLATSQRGVNSIAGRYVSDSDFRERITAVVETLGADVQTRFLRRVSIAAGQ